MNLLARWWPLALVASTLALGAAWLHERDDRMRAEGRVEVELARVDSLETVARADSVATVAATARADSIARAAQAAVEAALEEANEARARRPEVIERVVRDAAADSALVRAAVNEVAETYDAELSALNVALVNVEAELYATRDERDALRSELQSMRALNASLEAIIDGQREARPDFFEKWGGRLMWGAAGAALGYVGGKL